MRKTAARVLGLVVVSALCVWVVSKYIHSTGIDEGTSAANRRQAAPSPGRVNREGSTTTSSRDHRNDEAPIDDAGMNHLWETVVEDLAGEARDILRSQELPAPPTVEELTIARLKDTGLPQTIHGKVVDIEKIERMLEAHGKPLRLYARAKDGRDVSTSAIVEGKYTFGQLPSGSYRIFLAERDQMAGLVMEVNVDQNQQAQEVDIDCGECELDVTVLDEAGKRIESDSIELFLGGTDDKKHMFKRAKSIQHGTWRIKGLLSGQYIASAKVGNSNGGAMLNLEPGMNSCTIQIAPQVVGAE